ncbi:MAG: tRNA epoxyqueuosine(34) reductase QueG [Crocinitomicaceae bacterium]|nr:tRNA epoxyqueuosine(34) reductase QueG [Crocinitomicaceae bacterium]
MGKREHRAQDRKRALVREANALGFDAVGVSQAGFLEEEADRLEEWLRRDYHGEMGYLARNVDKRLDPRKLVPGAKSVVSLLYNYHTDAEPVDPKAPRVARYAYGQDYHYVIKWKLKELMKWAQQEWGEIDGRVFVDSAPVHERAWAAKGGLGWVGKNSLLLNQRMGSYFFIAELIIDVDLEPDVPTGDHCGTCTRCIDACPTGAIIQSGVVNGSKCISYFTIELRGAIPEPVHQHLAPWVFGCDVCQEVCPWNRHATPHKEPQFAPHPELLGMKRSDWEEMTEEVFHGVFRGTAVKRTGYEGLMRNVQAAFKLPGTEGKPTR